MLHGGSLLEPKSWLEIRDGNMFKATVLLTVCLVLVFIPPLQAWNRTGHMVIAEIAYSHLDQKTRHRVDALLRKHPDYHKLIEEASAEPMDQTRMAFWAAAIWPDRIRDDPRFFDDGAPPTPPLPGFPDMARHQMWHYFDINFSTDGTLVPKDPPVPNALTQIALLRKSIGNPAVDESIQTYQLPWLLHLVGDVHQPLHCANRYTNTQRDPASGNFIGDLGGNLVFIVGERNLHAYWDNLLGDAQDEKFIAALARDLTARVKVSNRIGLDAQEWIDEGFRIVKDHVYSFGDGGTKENPASLSDSYRAMARTIAEKQAVLAGYRLAALLGSFFGDHSSVRERAGGQSGAE